MSLTTHKRPFWAYLDPDGQLLTDVWGNVLLFNDGNEMGPEDDGCVMVPCTLTWQVPTHAH